MAKNAKNVLDVRGLLIHVSHYDPKWNERKAKEERFDAGVAVELIEAMAKCDMNTLVIDCADGVRYRSRPQMRRHYTVPMGALQEVADAAAECGIDVVPKLNFSKSSRNRHDDWMTTRSNRRRWAWMLPNTEYWTIAADLMAELVGVCRPKRFFHVGMDEDHLRSLAQYVADIKTLRRMVRRHRLRTVIWNDSCHYTITSLAQVHAEKCRAAEKLLPLDIVQVLWAYSRAYPSVARRIIDEGFDLWAAPGPTPRHVRQWKRAIAPGGVGMLLTRWIKCSRRNRKELVKLVNTLGPLC